MPWACLQFVIVVFPDHTHLLFLVCFIHMQPINEIQICSTKHETGLVQYCSLKVTMYAHVISSIQQLISFTFYFWTGGVEDPFHIRYRSKLFCRRQMHTHDGIISKH